MNPFNNLAELTVKHRLILPAPRHWWLLPDSQAVCGSIHGIDTVAGRAVATNGILLVLVTETGYFSIGHREWFEKNAEQPAETLGHGSRKSKVQKELECCAAKEYV